MPTITRDQVEHLAGLARIELSGQEIDRLADDLGVILDAVARVGEVASADVPPMSHPVPLANVMREDEARPSLDVEAALSGAPDAEDDRFVVPRILGEE